MRKIDRARLLRDLATASAGTGRSELFLERAREVEISGYEIATTRQLAEDLANTAVRVAVFAGLIEQWLDGERGLPLDARELLHELAAACVRGAAVVFSHAVDVIAALDMRDVSEVRDQVRRG